ncbi:putative UPF0481 protein [Acorus gramineus]|uniref:UPF0481 protein n=1 Tax=Acorus gramineus TaxID=55184 RepID=A0AAV9A620_ACOGR|nr:putative UPF0481 protein [Acorus gramineus]
MDEEAEMNSSDEVRRRLTPDMEDIFSSDEAGVSIPMQEIIISDDEVMHEVTINLERRRDIIIDVKDKDWANLFKRKLDDEFFVKRWRKEKCSIFRVPPVLRSENPEAYTPRVVSIGPYHRGRPDLMEMEKHKRRVTHLLFSRHSRNMVAKCFHEVRSLEKPARSCYADEIDIESREFTEMMILDGCFIISFLISQTWDEKQKNNMEMDDIYSAPLVYEDLIKVENQIPFLILKTLYELLVLDDSSGRITDDIYDLAIYNLRQLEPAGDRDGIINRNITQVHHLLHLFYQTAASIRRSNDHFHDVNDCERTPSQRLKGKSDTGEGGNKVSNWMRTASELQEAGVKFVGKSDCRFLSVSFRDGKMEIPTIRIFERTLPTLRNLIAFEQCFPDTNSEVTFFADLMDALIDTPRDVKVLQDAGILKIGLSNPKEVTQLFNLLCRHVYYDNSESYLREVYNKVNCYCDSRWHRYRAVLARDYFRNPWTIISVVAAVILLVLTFLQTFYGMFGYYNPRT